MGTQLSLTDLVENVASLDNQAFQNFLLDVYNKRAKQRSPAIQPQEADLLEEINMGFPNEQWVRLDLLDAQLEKSTLSEAEHAELMTLTAAYEAYMVHRLELLSQLAELRKITLREVMHQLGIGHESN